MRPPADAIRFSECPQACCISANARLGRGGLDRENPVSDNVWYVECPHLLEGPDKDVHSAYFESPKTMQMMRHLLSGDDRKLVQQLFGA